MKGMNTGKVFFNLCDHYYRIPVKGVEFVLDFDLSRESKYTPAIGYTNKSTCYTMNSFDILFLIPSLECDLKVNIPTGK